MKQTSEYFRLISPAAPPSGADEIEIHSHLIPIHYRRHARARHYVMRLYRNKMVLVTIPRQGTRQSAREFVASRKSWLEKQWRILEGRNVPPQVLRPGMGILLHGEMATLEVWRQGEGWELRFGGERARLAEPGGDLRPVVEGHLQGVAKALLTARTVELAAAHGARIHRVVVRNQKSRWGSCSHRGTISLNWRLIQLPPAVRDYIVVHELMHLRQLNHSARFWGEVERVCPDYRAAEEWLKQNSGQVGF